MANALSILLPNKKVEGDKIIAWAEARWALLSERGYGDSRPHQPRATGKNWYKELSSFQLEWFDQFWNKFAKKDDRNGAAMRWYQMGELSIEEYQHIVYAAGITAKERPELIAQGLTPIHGQGWLNKRRFDDIPKQQDTKAKQTVSKQQEKIIDLRRDLAHYASIDSDFARDEVERIKQRLEKLEGK